MDTMTLIIGKLMISDAQVRLESTILDSIEAWSHVFGHHKIPPVREVWLMKWSGGSYIRDRKLDMRKSWKSQNIPANSRILLVTPWTD